MKKSLKCRAKAYVSVMVSEPDEEGGPEPPPVYTLTRVHTAEYHTHVPDRTKHIAQSILELMKSEVSRNPCAPIGMITFLALTGAQGMLTLVR